MDKEIRVYIIIDNAFKEETLNIYDDIYKLY